MLPDTSKVRMTVPSMRGRLTVACGRAAEVSKTVMPNKNSNAGMCRRLLAFWVGLFTTPKLP